jgi:branched-chain amino acid transport system substrate-binding protein
MNGELRRPIGGIVMRALILLLAVGLVVFAGMFAAACGEDEVTTTTGATTGSTTVTTTVASTDTTGTTVPLPATIKIGAVIPLTGANAALGAQVEAGYKLAVADINAAGGVDVGGTKLPLELIILDDESDPAKTVQQLETQNSNGVVAYLGGAGSNLHAAAAGIAEKNKIAYLGIAFSLNSVHEQGFKYLFSPFPKSKDHAKATFDLLDSLSPKPTKIVIFQETTDGGKELTKYWNLEATTRGGYEITTYEYAPGTTDFSSMIMPAKAAGAQVVLAYPTPPDGLALMKQLKELDFNASVYFLVRAPDGPTFGENLGVDSDGVYLLPGWNGGLPYPGVKEMVERYKTTYSKPAAPALTGPSYACVQIIADAITRAASLDRDAVRDAIAATDLDTMVGPGVKFNPDGTSNVLDPVVMWQGGKQVLVFPPDVATAQPIYPATPWKDRK